jgi:hypothetical protein
MSSKQELSLSDGDSCGSATSQRSSTRWPISASGLRGLSIARTRFVASGRRNSKLIATVIRTNKPAASNTALRLGLLVLWALAFAEGEGNVLCSVISASTVQRDELMMAAMNA